MLLPGDPQRALAMAQAHLESPRMFNTRRGLWGYTGPTAEGLDVTIQATGMGGPSAAIVVEELIGLGARVLIRTGTCGAIAPGLQLGQIVAAREALAEDGTSRALAAGDRLEADPDLTAALVAAGAATEVTVASTDLFYDPREAIDGSRRAAGATAIEMEAAAVLAVSARHGVRSGCVLLVSDVLGDGGRSRLGDDDLERGGIELGAIALRALSADAATVDAGAGAG